MTNPSRFWRVAAWLFVLVNAGGAVAALMMHEQMHAELHFALLGVGFVAYLFMRAAASRKQGIPPAEVGDGRIEYLQQSVDAMALELERLGEAQRFNEKLKAEQKQPPEKP